MYLYTSNISALYAFRMAVWDLVYEGVAFSKIGSGQSDTFGNVVFWVWTVSIGSCFSWSSAAARVVNTMGCGALLSGCIVMVCGSGGKCTRRCSDADSDAMKCL